MIASIVTFNGYLFLAEGPLSSITEKFGVQWPLLIAQVINFCLVIAILHFFAFKPILKTLDARQKKIADGLQYTEEMKLQLMETEKKKHETLKQAVTEAKGIVGEAQKTSSELLEKEKQAAILQSEAILAKATEAIHLERDQMLLEARSDIAGLVIDITKQVLRKELSPTDQQAFLQSAVQQLSSQ